MDLTELIFLIDLRSDRQLLVITVVSSSAICNEKIKVKVRKTSMTISADKAKHRNIDGQTDKGSYEADVQFSYKRKNSKIFEKP